MVQQIYQASADNRHQHVSADAPWLELITSLQALRFPSAISYTAFLIQ